MTIFLVCLSLLTPDPHRLPVPPLPLLSVEGMRQAVGLVEGLVLARAVHTGMNAKQVERVLGKPSWWACDAGTVMQAYDPYSIQVFWSNYFAAARAGKPRVVEEVRYVWECWEYWGDREPSAR
jgi:hypothetical protein